MKDDQFDKLFVYMQGEFGAVHAELADIRGDIGQLRAAPDDMAKYISDNDTEQAARDAQFERLLEWARKVSEKTGIPLEGF